MTRKQHGGGKLGLAVVLALIGILAWYGMNNPSEDDPSAIMKKNQADPESALKYYQTTAYKYIHNEIPGGSIYDVERTVTKDDWQWFQENYENLFKQGDRFNIAGGIAPQEQTALSKQVVLRNLFEGGTDHPGNEIIERSIGDPESRFKVRKKLEMGGHIDIDVVVVREGDLWKVKGFGGQRQMLESN